MARRRTHTALALVAVASLWLAPAVLPAPGVQASLLPRAEALGEQDQFVLPVPAEKAEAQTLTGHSTFFDLRSMMSESALEELNLASLRLQLPENANYPSGEPTLSADGTNLDIPGQGQWSIQGSRILFTPASEAELTTTEVALTITSVSGHKSKPLTLTAIYPHIAHESISASEGQEVSIELEFSSENVDPRHTVFTLTEMPSGTTLSSNGRTLIIPGEGIWTLGENSRTVTFQPRKERLGQQPTTVHVTGTDTAGNQLPEADLKISTPVVPAVTRSNSYGQPVQFDIATYATNADLSTLEMVPYSEDTALSRSQDGLMVTVVDQGTWTLDKQAGRLIFQPASDKVRDVTPMGIRAKDKLGNSSSIAPMNVGYPQVTARYRAFTWGQTATFTPLDGSLNVQALTFAFVTAGMPEGSSLSESGRKLTVPGEGIWTFDTSTLTVTFQPEEDLAVEPHPATFSVNGIYAKNETRGTLHAQYSTAVPTARDDEGLSNSRTTPIVVDVLGNDTPAANGQGLDASTLTLRSASATNIEELVAGTGKRLVLPDEGTFEVTDAGAVRFIPAPGFVGRTRAIDYIVEDSKGLRATASLVVEVEPAIASDRTAESQDSGVNALYARLLPQNTATFSLFASVTALLIFTGTVSLWVGRQMDRDKREQR